MADIQEEQKKRFLDELKRNEVAGNVHVACTRLGYSRATVYYWKKTDAKFEAEWNDTVLEAKEKMADEAEFQLRNQMLSGNMTAVIFTLKNLRPKDWKDRSEVEHVEKRFKSYDEYIKYCEQNGIDPKSGLRIDSGSSQVEQGSEV